MAGPIIALEYLILLMFFGFLAFLLFYTIAKRSILRKSTPTGSLFLILSGFALFGYINYLNKKKEASQKFLGDYKLDNLDKKDCNNCKVSLKNNFIYDIIVNGKIMGHGKWSIESATDIPGYFLEIENGPHYVIWESDRKIEYIDRTKQLE